jgi:hypothetical protein
MTPGTYQPAGSLYSQGMSFGTPRDWSQGGMQYFDPSRVRPLSVDNQSRPMQAPRVQATTTPAYPQQGGANIQTGITVGPVLPQNIVNQEQSRRRGAQMTAPPQDAGQNYAPYMQHLNSLLSNAGNAAAIDYGRDASFANAQQMLGTQQARARAGTGWGGVALQQQGNQLGGQQQGLAMLLSLLGQFGV